MKKKMILLEIHNRALYETLCNCFESAIKRQKYDKTCINISDFDGVVYNLSNPNDDTTKLRLSIFLHFYKDLRQHGSDQLLKREYTSYLSSQPEENYSVTLLFDLTNLPEDWSDLAMKASLLKRNCFASVFEKYFEFQRNGETGHQTAVIHYRSDETLFVSALEDRVTVIFSTTFKEEDDIIIGKNFMQEFSEARRKHQQAPQVIFSYKTPPAELNDTDAIIGENRGYVTFVLQPRHITKQASDKTINMISMFRNYLHYHLKCSKAFMHQRMRAKTNDFLKVLNRAKPEQKSKPPEERKNFFGKTMRQTP